MAFSVIFRGGEECARVYAAHFVLDGARAFLQRAFVVAEECAEVFSREGVLHVVFEAAGAADDDWVVHVRQECAYVQRRFVGQRRQQEDALHTLWVAAGEQRVERGHAL